MVKFLEQNVFQLNCFTQVFLWPWFKFKYEQNIFIVYKQWMRYFMKTSNSNSHFYRDEASSHRSKDTHHMIQIFIKTPINPKTLCLRLDHKTTVSDLKDIIHRKLAIRPALQNLYTNNKRFKVWSIRNTWFMNHSPLHLSIFLNESKWFVLSHFGEGQNGTKSCFHKGY